MSITMTKALEATSKAIASIDTTDANRRIAELESQKEEFAAAIQRAEERASEIAILINNDRLDPVGAADALLDGGAGTAERLGVTIDQMRAELASLRAGISELRGRTNTAKRAIDEIRDAVGDKVRNAVKPLALALKAEAGEAVERLLILYAASEALHSATRQIDTFAVAETLRAVLPRTIGRDSIVPQRERVEVPDDVLAALAGLSGLGAAHMLALPKSVARPW